ncbi:hypothetical protein JHK85_019187 [Glycine max]|nr:hypothetical protein JHK85_019187 [Glycine max]
MDQHLGQRDSKLAAMESEEAEECTSTTGDASFASVADVSEVDTKVEFDLNERLNADDGKCSEIPGSTPAARLGAVLSSSPAVPYQYAPFKYPVFPFNSICPLPSASFSGGSTPYVDTTSGGRLCFPVVVRTRAHTTYLRLTTRCL